MKRIAALFLLVAACSPQPQAANDSADVNNDANVAAPAEPGPSSNSAAPPEPASIPANFRGLWAADQVSCGHLTHHSRLTVTADSVRYPAFVLAVESITQPTPNSFAVKGYNKQTKAATEAHFSLDVTGNILTDEAGGGTIRVRCT